MHRISDNRPMYAWLKLFANICGDETMCNVILATTMWGTVKEELGARREKVLKEEAWKSLLEKGATAVRFYGTFQSAWEIVDTIMEKQTQPRPLLIQQEMVDFRKRMNETTAGITFSRELMLLQTEAIRKLQDEASEQNNPLLVKDLEAQIEEMETRQQESDNRRLPLAKQIRRFFSHPVSNPYEVCTLRCFWSVLNCPQRALNWTRYNSKTIEGEEQVRIEGKLEKTKNCSYSSQRAAMLVNCPSTIIGEESVTEQEGRLGNSLNTYSSVTY
jgi:hypothetical protein